MRKLISLGILALFVSVLAGPAVAGNVEICDGLKDSGVKGLYGLCIAYHNTSDGISKQRIGDNFKKKSGNSGIIMPDDSVGTCPCFTGEEILNAGSPFDCAISSSGTGLDLALYEGGLFQFGTDDLGCFNYDFSAPQTIELPALPDENGACRDLILKAAVRDFGVENCQEGDS
jgi:hypothetical protein